MFKRIFVSLFLLFALTTNVHAYTVVGFSDTTKMDTLVPRLDNIEPNTVLVGENKLITITGKGFSDGITLKIGQWTASNVSVNTQHTQLTATAPSGDKGTFDVLVNNPNGTNYTQSNGFTYETPPTNLLCEPVSGIVGETIKLTGSNFNANEKAGTLMMEGEPVTIYAVGDTVVSGNEIYANDEGEFVVNFVIPKRPGGAVKLVVANAETTLEIKAQISVSPENGRKRTLINLVGNGFGESEKIIIDFGDTKSIRDVDSKTDGSFEAAFDADEQEPGEKVIVAKGTTSGISATSTFELLPTPDKSLLLEPTTGPVETKVKVTGEGFESNAEVGKLTINGVETPVVSVGETAVIDGSIWANEDGTFAVRFEVPKQPGGGLIVAVGDANSRFVITTQLFVTPEIGPVGTTIKVEGNGFANDEPIKVDFGNTKGIAEVKTTSDGSFEVTFETDSQDMGMKEVVATGLLSERTTKATFELTEKPSSEPATISIKAAPTEIVADSLSTSVFTITVEDADGHGVGGQKITVTPSAGKVSSAEYQGNGVYLVTYTSDTNAGKVTISASTENGKTDQVEITLTPGSPKFVTVDANPGSIVGDGSSQATITVTVKDAYGNPITDAQVEMKVEGSGNVPEYAIHKGNGSYEAIYTAGKEEGNVKITATAGETFGETGITLTQKPTTLLTLEPKSGSVGTTVKATGEGFEPDISVGKLTVNDVPVSVTGVGTTVVMGGENIRTDSEGKFVVKFKAPKGPGGNVLVVVGETGDIFEITARILNVSPESGAAGANITIQGDGFAKEENVLVDFGETEGIADATTQDDGSFEATFEVDVQESGVKQIRVTGDLSERSATADFELLKSTAKTIEITAEPTEIEADGVSTATLTITVKDDGERPVIEEDITLTITPQSGTTTTAIHQGNGIYTATYTSDTKAGNVKILATTSNNLTADTFLTLLPGPADVVTVGANPSVLSGDGKSTSKITAIFKDAHGNLVPDETVTMAVGGAAGTLENDDGETGTTIIASNVGDGTYTATYTSAEISQEQEIATVTASTQNNVEGKVDISLSRTPDFSLSAEEMKKEAQPGKPLVYLIDGIGQNGFVLPMKLSTEDMPKGVEWEFAPESAEPTIAEPKVKIQLTLRIPDTLAQGEYNFTVLGMNLGEGVIRYLNLGFTIQKVESDIFAIPTPKEVPLGGSIRVSGQVMLQEGDEQSNLEVQLAYHFGDEMLVERTAIAEGAQREYSDELPITADIALGKIGDWKVTACWKGDNKYQRVCREAFFTVIKGPGVITLEPSVEVVHLGERVTITVKLLPELADQPFYLAITPPDGNTDGKEVKTGKLGIFQYELRPTQRGDYTFEATWGGNDSYNAASEKITLTAIKEPARAIIALGGGDETTNQHWLTFNRIAQHVYKTFKRCNKENLDVADDEYIYFLSPSQQASDIIDSPTSAEWLKYAITEWAEAKVNKYVPLVIYLISHNRGDKFLLAKGNEDEYLTPEMLDEWLSVLPEGTPVIIVIEACYSGNFIAGMSNGNPVLSKFGRTIITSASEDVRAELLPNRSSFSKYFFDGVENNQDILTAFFETREKLSVIPQHRHQNPQLDANGNGIPNEQIDYALLGQSDAKKRIYIPDESICAGEPPELQWVTFLPESLKEGESKATIKTKISGLDISSVVASITPPVYDENDLESSYDEIELLDKGGGVYEAEYDKFILPGSYTVVVNAINPEGDAIPVIAVLTVEGEKTCPSDVNGDGEVNISDLVLVGSNFGKSGTNIKGDVNGDGTVDIIDLVLVGKDFGSLCPKW